MGISMNVIGITSVSSLLTGASKSTKEKANQAIIKAGFFIEGEVKQSISGHRAEPRSVDTGRFLNSVKAGQKKYLTATIDTNVPYSNILEYGSSTRQPRHHFTNSAKRNEVKVKDFIEAEIK